MAVVHGDVILVRLAVGVEGERVVVLGVGVLRIVGAYGWAGQYRAQGRVLAGRLRS